MNMSYCRFQNTLIAMEECREDFVAPDEAENGDGLSHDELNARNELIDFCREMAQERKFDGKEFDDNDLVDVVGING